METHELLAPCGLNCALCMSYQRTKKPCSGCRGGCENKTQSCLNCAIKNCAELIGGGFNYCIECPKFPCPKIKNLEKRYSKKYHTSPIGNLRKAKEIGAVAFIVGNLKDWTCPNCGQFLCVHKDVCEGCGMARFED